MRVLQVNKFLCPKGGSETYMFGLGKGLTNRNIEVGYWGMTSPQDVVPCEGIPIASKDLKGLPTLQKVAATLDVVYSLENKRKFRATLESFQPDIVHVHNFNFQITPSILDVALEKKIPVVYTAHDSQFVCPVHRLYQEQHQRCCDLCVKGSFLNAITNNCFGSRGASIVGAAESILHHSRGIYQTGLDTIIAPSSFLASLLKHRISTPIQTIPNFVQDPAIDFTISKDIDLLYVGRISPEKGILKAAQQLSAAGIPLSLVGDGPDFQEISGLPHCTLLGRKSGTELFTLLARAKFLIQPSLGWENCPMVVLESMACGTPVLVPRHSGFVDLVQEDVNGYYLDFQSGDFPQEIQRILADSSKSLGGNCRNIYLEKFSESAHLEKILQLYKALL